MKTKILALLFLAAAAHAAVTVPVTNTAWYFSPYNWRSNGGSGALQGNNVQTGATSVTCVAVGCYFKVSVYNSSSIVLTIATSCASCKARWYVVPTSGYGGTMTNLDLTSGATSITLSSASQTIQTIQFWVYSSGNSSVDRWNGPNESITIVDMTLSAGSLTPLGSSGQSQVLNESGNIVVFGDSITEGYATIAAGVMDATQSWVPLVARGLNAEYGQVGYSCQGWTTGACAGTNVPKFHDTATPANSTWRNYSSGATRLFSSKLSPVPDYVIVNLGTNDGATDVTATAQSWIVAARAAVSSTTPIVVIVPFSGAHSSQLAAAVTAAADSHTYLVNTGSTMYATSAGVWSLDGTHPTFQTGTWLAAKVARGITQAAGSSGAGTTATLSFQ